MPIALEEFHLSGRLLSHSLHEGAEESVWDDQTGIVGVLYLGQLLLDLCGLLELGLAQVFVSLLQQVQHLAIVKGKCHVSNLALLAGQPSSHQALFYLLD